MAMPTSHHPKSSADRRYDYEQHYRNILHKSATLLIPRRQPESEKVDKFNLSVCTTNLDTTLDTLNMSFDTSFGGEDIIEASRRRRLARSRPSSRGPIFSESLANQKRGASASQSFTNQKARQLNNGYVYNKQPDIVYGSSNSIWRNHVTSHEDYRGLKKRNGFSRETLARIPRMHRPRSTEPNILSRCSRNSYQMREVYCDREPQLETETDTDQQPTRMNSEDDVTETMNQLALENKENDRDVRREEDEVFDIEENYPLEFSPNEIYYFGCLNLPMDHLSKAMENEVLPGEFYDLMTSECRVAYTYSTLVYGRQPEDVDTFYKRFNRDFFTYTSDGMSDVDALYLICKNLRDVHREMERKEAQLKLEKELKEYEEQENRLTIRLRTSTPCQMQVQDIVDNQQAPYVHRSPHAFMCFGRNGRAIALHPDHSMNVLHLSDVKSLFDDDQSLRLLDAIQTFKGPLIRGQTPPHSIGLYIRKQIERIRNSPVAQSNPTDNDVVDCVLIWQLLQMVVQQQGRVTGPDLAQLLISASPSNWQRETVVQRSLSAASSDRTHSPVPISGQKAQETFSKYLLEGHIDIALEFAMRHNLFSEALILARRLGHQKLLEIEDRYMQTRCADSPVTTLVAVASNQRAPILSNPSGDDGVNWRLHAAIVLANLTSEYAMSAIYQLGRVLARREYHAAGDFCLLSVALLSTFDPFKSTEEGHLNLIHASLPDDNVGNTNCRFGFSLRDFHATEIFSFGISLGREFSPLRSSQHFQKMRLQYAKLIAGFGGFEPECFRYCLDVGCSVWPYYHQMSLSFLNELCDLAEQVHIMGGANSQETLWINELRLMIAQVPIEAANKVQAPEPALLSQEMHHPPNETSSVPEDRLVDKWNNNTAEQSHHDPLDNPGTCTDEPVVCSRRSSSSYGSPSYVPPYTPLPGSPKGSSHQNETNHEETLTGEDSSTSKSTNDVTSASKSSNNVISTTDDTNTQPLSTISLAPPPLSQNSPPLSQNPPPLSQNPPPLPRSPPPTMNSRKLEEEYTNVVHPIVRQPVPQKSSSYGLLDRLKKSVLNIIPDPNPMILPDDRKKSIVWDEKKGRYVGDGIAEEAVPVPPPMIDSSVVMQSTSGSPTSGGLREVRSTGKPRYLSNGAMLLTIPSPDIVPITNPTPPPLPHTFSGFMPTMPEQDDATLDSPFSLAPEPDVTVESNA